MGESLTPHLTREQFRMGYLSYITKENSVNLMNLAANQTFALEGETLGVLYNKSTTVAGVSREQKLAILAMKMQGYLKQPDLTLRKLPQNQLDLLYVGVDQIKDLIGKSLKLPMDDLLFQQYMSQLLNASKDTAGFVSALSTAVPNAGDIPSANQDLHTTAQNIDPDAAATGATNSSTIDHTNTDGSPSVAMTAGGNPSSTSNDTFVGAVQNTITDAYAGIAQDVNAARGMIRRIGDFTLGNTTHAQLKSDIDKANTAGEVTPHIKAAKQHHETGKITKNQLDEVIQHAKSKIKDINAKKKSQGGGLMDKVRRERRTGLRGPRGRIIMGEGLVPFGKYQLDMHDLDNNEKVCIRYDCGKLVKAIPTKIVGGSVAGALKAITKGKNPSAKDVENMTEDERNYLNLISKKASVKDLQVPSKNKSSEEKEIHKFETMKGEIIAGNDNINLIKEFKLLLIKLKKNHRISRDDANDILLELAALGY